MDPGIGPADCCMRTGAVGLNDAPPTSLLAIKISERRTLVGFANRSTVPAEKRTLPMTEVAWQKQRVSRQCQDVAKKHCLVSGWVETSWEMRVQLEGWIQVVAKFSGMGSQSPND